MNRLSSAGDDMSSCSPERPKLPSWWSTTTRDEALALRHEASSDDCQICGHSGANRGGLPENGPMLKAFKKCGFAVETPGGETRREARQAGPIGVGVNAVGPSRLERTRSARRHQ